MIHSIWILSVLYCISTYLLFLNDLHNNTIANILISLNLTSWSSCCIFFEISTIHLSFLRPIKRDYSPLSLDFIAYSVNNAGKRYVFVIYIHKGKGNSLIFILLIFCLLHQKLFQDKTMWLFIIVLHFVKKIVWYLSVFNKYSFYCDLFRLGTTLCLFYRHHHVWVRYFNLLKN